MRVIAGHAHGRRLKAPQGLKTRPASARSRESIFSRLAAWTDLNGLRVLDSFAGSGSLGIEALSRGAASVTFVDMARAATGIIRENVRVLGMEDRARVITADIRRALRQLSARHASFDLVFVDPPYAADISGEVLERLAALALVSPGGWLVVRQSRRAPGPPPAPGGFECLTTAIVGDDRIAYYQRSQDGAEGKSI